MRNFSITIITAFILCSSLPTFGKTLKQIDCYVDFNGCMNDAELDYTSTVGAIQGSEQKARKSYIKAVTACVNAYDDCPKF